MHRAHHIRIPFSGNLAVSLLELADLIGEFLKKTLRMPWRECVRLRLLAAHKTDHEILI